MVRLRFLSLASVVGLLGSTQAANPQPAPNSNIDLSSLGQVVVAGDYDALSIYQYVGQVQGSSNNGSQSVLSQLPNGAFDILTSTDGTINAMVPLMFSDGSVHGIVVGGNFSSIGGVPAQGVALFNASTNAITPLPGINGVVTALLSDSLSNTVYCGGSFEAANSTNAIAWIGTTGWANLPFAGFNAPVTSITQSPDGTVVFGGSFSGLGNMTTPAVNNQQSINLKTANLTTTASTNTPGYSNPQNIVCPANQTSSPTSTWLLADNVPGSWTASMQFGYVPTKLRLWNANQDGRGTKTWRFTAHPINGILNFTYVDPVTGQTKSCTATCPLAQNSSIQYQDFTFVNSVGMNSFTIDISEWYGSGGGLNGIELFQDDIFSYAVADFNEPACTSNPFPPTVTTTGPWTVTPSGQSVAEFLTANIPANAGNSTSVVFQPDIKQSGDYTIIVYTPGCLPDNSCSSRGIVQVTGTLTANGSTIGPAGTVYQTNKYEKYDTVYLGPIDAASSSFRPSVTLSPAPGQGPIQVVASRIKYGLTSTTDGLNGLFEYNPNRATVDTNFTDSAINNAGTELHSGAVINALVTQNQTIYAGGKFTDDRFENILAFSNNNATSLAGNGLNAAVTALFSNGDFLYVGGAFTNTSTGGTPGLNYAAAYQYSKNAWVALGNGLNGAVEYIVPLSLNITAGRPETTIAISGNFTQVLASGSSSASSVNGFAVWVPSRSDWLQNINTTAKQYFTGQLITWVDDHNGTSLVAGTLSSSGDAVTGAAGLQQSSSGVNIQQLPINIQSSSQSSSLTKRALIGQQNVTGVVSGLYYNNGGRNVTVFGGHFAASASNGSTVNNLLFLNGSNNNAVTGLPSGVDSNSTFLAMATTNDVLLAGGSVTGHIAGAQVNGIMMYDMLHDAYSSPQPAALAGDNVVVNAIVAQSSKFYVGGSFTSTSQGLQCNSVCMYDATAGQWNAVGSNLAGTVSALFWASSTSLMAAGNLTVGANSTSAGSSTGLATYSTSSQTWTAQADSHIPGPVTAFTPATSDGKHVWVAGTAQNGSTFLMEVDGSNYRPVVGLLGAGTVVRSLQVLKVSKNHGSTQYLDDDRALLVSGELSLTNWGNCSAAIFNGTYMEPLVLATTATGGSGSVNSVFSSNVNSLASSSHGHAKGIVVLVALCAALGTIFLIILIGLILERIQRKKAGYSSVPSAPYTDKHSNINRVPPERLFGSLGQNGARGGPAV